MQNNRNGLRYHSYTISYDSVQTYPMSPELEKVCLQMNNLLRSDPQKAYQQLQIVSQKYPNDPMLQVYLSIATITNANDLKAAKSLIIKNYQQFPDYFFARAMYIELCIEEENLEEAANAFNHKFDLQLLYPHRSVFHISEALSFCKVGAKYFYLLGKTEQADIFVDMIKQLDSRNSLIGHLERYAFYCAAKNFLKNPLKWKGSKSKTN